MNMNVSKRKCFTAIIILSLTLRNFPETNCAEYKFSSEQELKKLLLTEYERNMTIMCNRMNIATYNYNVNLTEENERILAAITLAVKEGSDYYYKKYFKGLDKNSFSTEWLRRQMRTLTKVGDAALPKNDYEKLIHLINSMASIYGKAKICPFKRPRCNLETEGLPQEPDIEDILAKSRNVDELAYVWQSWRKATGRKIKNTYVQYVKLKNQAAKRDGFVDAGAAWRYEYEIPNMEDHMDRLWLELKPLYETLHTYVLNKLADFYGEQIDVEDGLMPAHITGNNYAQSWSDLMPIVIPFPDADNLNVTNALLTNNYTVLDLFQTANQFYTSMGLADMSMAYGPKAMLTRPDDREVLCHASAWSMCDGKDYRISMCTLIDRESFSTIHHELGHIQYYIQYNNQPSVFKNSANPGFHEAIGDAIVLSSMNAYHFKTIGLIDPNYKPSYESTINSLMEAALETIPNIPFTYLLDKWRWNVFKGKHKPTQWNNLWWYYRRTVQKVKPPMRRTPLDFDAGSKFHVADDTEYMAYFIAIVLKFQIYRGLCVAAGQFDSKSPEIRPLHTCDFYGSKAAGMKLKSALKLGSSVHWNATLQLMAGQSYLDTTAVYDYFRPLIEFLQSENKKYK